MPSAARVLGPDTRSDPRTARDGRPAAGRAALARWQGGFDPDSDRKVTRRCGVGVFPSRWTCDRAIPHRAGSGLDPPRLGDARTTEPSNAPLPSDYSRGSSFGGIRTIWPSRHTTRQVFVARAISIARSRARRSAASAASAVRWRGCIDGHGLPPEAIRIGASPALSYNIQTSTSGL